MSETTVEDVAAVVVAVRRCAAHGRSARLESVRFASKLTDERFEAALDLAVRRGRIYHPKTGRLAVT